ncbi:MULTISPECIES: NAD-binding protein [Amycolatopsis]|uniref:NAD-binding protein n=1 Tax=Amycolatopsis thermalba TaxID=944492 RepID=A0ABY4NZ35_9PSEU|nr:MULTISPECIES: NAD-binding protein [Amycolatopsis]OXM75134.1 ion transporter [Amycolatopsis sp. KNN50.9b]UQS25261.1 NAD-binding protein [Amycolatopsis thermalba]
MPIFLTRLIARLVFLRSWLTPVLVIVFVFVTSWPLMALAEPAGSDLVRPANYWWYFVVTAATVGYGDFYPVSGAGHVVGAYVVIGGIVTLTTVFTKLAAVLEEAKGRRMQGVATVTAADHVVLLGYTAGRTERLVRELVADGAGRIVLCAWDEVTTHPMPEQDIDFVRGDLTGEQVLRRAVVQRARAVLIDARDDNEALAIAVTVDHLAPDAHVVITLRDMARADLIHYVDPGFRCVQWHTPRMVTEELTSPGIAEVYAELMTHGGANTYSAVLPAAVPVERCQTTLSRQHRSTLLAIRTGERLVVNPPWDAEVPAGSTIYYVGPRRLTGDDIEAAFAGGGSAR